MVVDKPLRSGQKVYARGGDLVVLAMVNQGAEIAAIAPSLASLLVFCAVLLPLSALVLRAALRKAARDGTLGQA